MTRFVPIILASGLISFLLTPLVVRVATALDFVDKPQSQKMHSTPTPMLGGIAIYLGLVAVLAFSDMQPFRELIGILTGMTIVMIVGLIDDRYGTPPWVRLLAEAVAGLVLVWSGIEAHLFENETYNVILTVVWVIGICNAINLQDNMDGLAAGLATVAAGSFFVLAVVEELGLVASLAAATLGACVGFLYYNFNPARLFMGDTGSLLLGFVLAVLGIKLEFVGRPLSVTWIIPVIILGIPVFDTTLVVLSRIRRGLPIYQGGKDHTSHRLVSVIGMTHARAVMTLYLIASALGLVALMMREASRDQARIILIILGSLFVISLVYLEWSFVRQQASEEVPTH